MKKKLQYGFFLILGFSGILFSITPSQAKAAANAANTTAYIFEAASLLKLPIEVGDLELFLFTLQGIVNRGGPRLFLTRTEDQYWFHGWPRADEKWIEYCTEKKGITFVKLGSLQELVDTFRNDIKGLVLYDQRPDKHPTRLVAVTLGGLEDLLPVSERLAALDPISQFKVKYDFRHRWDGEDYLEPYRWALRELMPRCDRTIACSIPVHWWSTYIDYPVMRRAFCFCLNHHELIEDDHGVLTRKECQSDQTDKTWKITAKECKESGDGGTVDLYKTRNELPVARKIYGQLKAPAFIFGGGRPNEMQYVSELSKCGHSYICSQFANLSFFSKIPVSRKQFRQDFHVKGKHRLASKYYIAFITSDGDAPKLAQTFYAGHWFDPARGSVPITWTINPAFVEWFPVFYEYLYSSATENDYFMCAANGAGSPQIQRMPDLVDFARYSARLCAKADLHYADLECRSQQSVERFSAAAPSIEGFTNCLPFDLDPPIRFVNKNIPWATCSAWWYWKKNTPQELKRDIERICENLTPPYFLILYPDFPAGNVGADWKNPDLPRRIPTLWKNTLALLDTARYEAVTADAFFDLVKQARGRIPHPGFDAVGEGHGGLGATDSSRGKIR